MYESSERSRGRTPLTRGWLGGCCGVALTLLLVYLCALGVSGGALPQGRGGLFGRVALAVGTLCAALVAAGGGGDRQPRVLLSGGVMLSFTVLLAIFCGVSSPFNMSLLWNLLLVICGVLAVLFLGGKRGRRRRRRNRDYSL